MNMATLMLGINEYPIGATPIVSGKIILVNHNWHNLKQK